jgi:hypothetical protein
MFYDVKIGVNCPFFDKISLKTLKTPKHEKQYAQNANMAIQNQKSRWQEKGGYVEPPNADVA